MKRLEYRKVTMRFAGAKGSVITAIEDVDIALDDGEVVSLIGPSGCGKSTLLNIGAGLYAPSVGDAYVDGERVEGPNAHVAFMLQKDLLLPWRTIEQNVMLGAEIRKLDKTKSRQKARDLLHAFKLGEFAERYPHQLSGGMRQRAALSAHACGRSVGAAAGRAVLGGRCADPHHAAARSRADIDDGERRQPC